MKSVALPLASILCLSLICYWSQSLLPGLLEKIILDPHAPVVWADLKPVTVLFANLLGLGEMVEAMGEEEADEVAAILDRYLGAVLEIVAIVSPDRAWERPRSAGMFPAGRLPTTSR